MSDGQYIDHITDMQLLSVCGILHQFSMVMQSPELRDYPYVK